MPNAQHISRLLSAAGMRPLPSGTPRTREGIRVSRSHDRVQISVDLDVASERNTLRDLVVGELTGKFAVDAHDEDGIVIIYASDL